jgi:hypothetical protein
MDAIIFKVTSPHWNLLRRYFPLINYALDVHIGSIFLESIENGFLYICKNSAEFIRLNQPLTSKRKAQLNSILSNNPPIPSNELNGNDIISAELFPKDGLVFTYSAQNAQSIALIPLFVDYYNSLHTDITIEKKETQQFELKYHSFIGFQFHISLIYLSSKI